MNVDQNTPYPFKGNLGQAWKDFNVLCNTGEISRYPLFWIEFALQLHTDIVAKLSERDLKIDKLEKVVEAARATLSFTDIGCGCDLQVNWICGPCALDKYLKELDGEK